MQEIEQIYTQYRQDVYRYLCSLTRDAALAEDLLSETFLRAQGYSFAEIAQRCGVSESAARTLDFRTRHWLREQLQKEGAEL